jgi:putative ABC transport system substrate-binding protein
MRRREFTVALAGAALWPLPSLAQKPERMRRVGVLTGLAEDDPATTARLAAFREGMAALGWAEDRNLRIDGRFAAGFDANAAAQVAELLALGPDVLLVQGPGVPATRAAATTVPIVFVVGGDPVGAGWVESLAHPGGTITGFTATEPSFGPKWLELLKEIAPHVRSVAVLSGGEFWRQRVADAATKFGVEIAAPPIHSPADIEAAVTALAEKPDGGLVLPIDTFTAIHRKQIIALAMRYRLPLVTGNPPFPQDGGLLYYGADIVDIYRRSAAYVDRILKGEKPADLPVQQPTKFELVINLKTAVALGLTVPQVLLAQADEVIE